jgi:hypothetical protein
MNHAIKSTILLAAALLMVVCSSTKSSSQINSQKQIEVFRENGQQPSREYRELGLLTDDGKEIEQPKIEEKMIEKARKMGGDAIIFMKPSYSGTEGNAVFVRGFAIGGSKVTFLFRGAVVAYK